MKPFHLFFDLDIVTSPTNSSNVQKKHCQITSSTVSLLNHDLALRREIFLKLQSIGKIREINLQYYVCIENFDFTKFLSTLYKCAADRKNLWNYLSFNTKMRWFHRIFAKYSQTSFSMLSFLFGFDLPIIRLQRKCYLFCLNKDIWIDSLVSKFKCAVYTTFFASKYASIFSGANYFCYISYIQWWCTSKLKCVGEIC